MSSPQSEAKKNTVIETRSAYAGESLYDLAKKLHNLKAMENSYSAALESDQFSLGEKKVLLSSLMLLPGRESCALEDSSADIGFDFDTTSFGLTKDQVLKSRSGRQVGFDSGDPNQTEIDRRREDHGNAGEEQSNYDVGSKIKEGLKSVFSAAFDKIGKIANSIKESLQDFYDARLNWYGNLLKEIETLSSKADKLEGGAFANKQMISQLTSKKANRTYPTPMHRTQVVQQEVIKALMVAEHIKTSAIQSAKALSGDERALERSVDALIKLLRSSSIQEAETLVWRWDSFSGVVTCQLGRGVEYANLSTTDFNLKSIDFVTSDNPSVDSSVSRATEDVLVECKKHAAAAQQIIKNSVGKNDSDIWDVIASMNVNDSSEHTEQPNKINGVMALIAFADRIHEFIAKAAQQSYYDSVYNTVKWVDLSIKDAVRTQGRQT